jgi:hypothetical protein
MITELQLQAIALLKHEVDIAKRTAGVPLAPSFIKSADPETPPALARLLGAGRGGEVRMKLFLTFALRATRGRPILAARRPPGLARMLALAPETGPRRVSDAMRWLRENNFIHVRAQTGQPGEITLLDGEDPPNDLSGRDTRGHYVSVPIELWTSGHILEMKARDVAVLIALLDVTSNPAREGSLTGFRKAQYGISDDSWTRALKELRKRNLVDYRTEIDEGDDRVPRKRQIYSRVSPALWKKLA